MQGFSRRHGGAAGTLRYRGGISAARSSNSGLEAFIRRPTKIIAAMLGLFLVALMVFIAREDDRESVMESPTAISSSTKSANDLQRTSPLSPSKPVVHAILVDDNHDDSMCVCFHGRRHLRALEDVLREGVAKPADLPKKARKTFSTLTRFSLPSAKRLHDTFNTPDFSSLSAEGLNVEPGDSIVVDVSFTVVSCHDGYKSKNNGSFGLCYRTKEVRVGDSSNQTPTPTSESVESSIQSLLGVKVEPCMPFLSEDVLVVDIPAVEKMRINASGPSIFGETRQCHCPVVSKPPQRVPKHIWSNGGPTLQDKMGAPKEDYGSYGVALRVLRSYAPTFSALQHKIVAVESLPLNSKVEEARRMEATRRAYNKTVLLCDPRERLHDIDSCMATIAPHDESRAGVPGALSRMQLLWLKDVDGSLACYPSGDIVCDTVKRDGVWETEIGSFLTSALRQMEQIVLNARHRLSSLALQLAKVESQRPGGSFVMPPTIEEDTVGANGVEFVDIGSNVGAFSVYMWRMGYPTTAIDALPTNVFLQRVSKCVNENEMKRRKAKNKKAPPRGTMMATPTTTIALPPYEIVHSALSSSTTSADQDGERCALFSEDSNFGDAQILCGAEADALSHNTLKRRSWIQKKTLDALMIDDKKQRGAFDAAADAHINPLARLASRLLSPTLVEFENNNTKSRLLPEQLIKKERTTEVLIPILIRNDLEAEEWQKLVHLWDTAQVSTVVHPKPYGVAKIIDPSGNLILPHNMPYRHEIYVYVNNATMPDLDHQIGFGPDTTVQYLQDILRWKHYIVKMDVETHELEAMRGGERFLSGVGERGGGRPKFILSEVLRKLNATAFFELMVDHHGYAVYSTARKCWALDAAAGLRMARWLMASGTTFDTVIFVEPAYANKLARWTVQCADNEPLRERAVQYVRELIAKLPLPPT